MTNGLFDSRINFLLKFVSIGLVFSIIYHLIISVLSVNFAPETFLFSSLDRFNDWHNSVISSRALNPYFSDSPALATYFPFAYLLFEIGTHFDRLTNVYIYNLVSFLLFIISIIIYINNKKDCRNLNYLTYLKVIIIFLLSYPLIFSIDRGNIDIWISSFCIIYLALLDTKKSYVGFISLSIAIAIKGYPLIFLLLALRKKKFFWVIMCILISISISVLSMALFAGGIEKSIIGLGKNMTGYYTGYILGPHSLFATSDFFSATKTLFIMFHDGLIKIDFLNKFYFTAPNNNEKLFSFYLIFITSFLFLSSIFIYFSTSSSWIIVLIVCIVAILFPNIANDYKLCILIPGVLALLFSSDFSKTANIALIMLALLLIPKRFFLISGMSISNLINPLIIFLLWLILICDFKFWYNTMLNFYSYILRLLPIKK